MGIYKAEAIVLRSRVYGEADRILTLFTREAGKVSAIAKGVRKPTSRLRGAVQLFSHTHLVLYTGKSLDTITQGEAEETFCFLQEDLERLAAASGCAELVDRLTLEKQPSGKVFHLLLTALRVLEKGDPELLARVFEIKLLAALGYQPQLEGCVMGRHEGWRAPGPEVKEAGPVWFSIEKGGVLCADCAAHCPGALPLSPATIGALGYFLRTRLDRAVRAKIGKVSLLELASLLRSFFAYHGEVNVRTWDFLDDLRKNQAPSFEGMSKV
ncbi:MAG: DNA repair protein RecO [Bacillota bacterium]|jgi:DNA repair protein RecO (recombination protein O)|nr:DNA repair protein RecO [Bacillota bacterium]